MVEAEINRIGAEVALRLPKAHVAKAEAYFECALAVARQQQAKSWELRAAMSTARLWRDQGKHQQVRDSSVFLGQHDGDHSLGDGWVGRI